MFRNQAEEKGPAKSIGQSGKWQNSKNDYYW